MAGIKISELPEASCILGNELVAIVQESCTKFVSASAIGSTGSDNITGITTGCGLVGGGSAGSINIAMDNNCFDAFDGAHTTLAATSACWDGNYTTVQSNSGSWDQSACPGLNCVGMVECLAGSASVCVVDVANNFSIEVHPTCNTAWNGTTTTVAANSASWVGGTGDITAVIAGTLLSGGATSGDATLGIDSGALSYLDQSACAGLNCVGDLTTSTNQTICGNKCFFGNILSAGVNLDQLFGSGGTVLCGTNDTIAVFNAAGNNIEDSNITDNGTVVAIGIDTTITGDLMTGGSHTMGIDTNSAAIVGGASNEIQGTACCGAVIGGGSNKACTQGSVTIGGMMNETNACFSSTIGGALNKTCGSGTQSVVLGGCTNIAKHDSTVLAGGTNMTSVSGCMLHAKTLWLDSCTLPGSDPGVPGVVWNDNGTLKIST